MYCGRVSYVEEGEVRFDEDRQAELHFRFPNGQIFSYYADDVAYRQKWFHTREKAEDYLELLKEERANS